MNQKIIDTDARESTDCCRYRERIKQSQISAKRYQYRKPRKHRAELRLVKRAMLGLSRQNTVLDIPCGAGRVTILLQGMGYTCEGADIGVGAVESARRAIQQAGFNAQVEKQDLEKMSYTDRSFDTIICFRVFHHFPSPDIRRRVISELCRVARRNVMISYFSPYSYTSIRRKIRMILGGKRSRQHATPLSELSGYFSEQGFILERNLARTPFIHTLHLAVFRRITR